MIGFRVEPVREAWDDILPLAREAWDETAGYEHDQGFDMQLDRYEEYERAGMMHCAVVRDDGHAVGYVIGYISPSMRTQKLICVEDMLYLKPAYRGRGIATAFIEFAEEVCRSVGVVQMVICANLDTSVPRILESLDYRKTAVQYIKDLSRADSAQYQLAVTEPSSDEICGPPDSR